MSLEFEQQITLDLTVQKVQNVHCSEDDKNSRNIVIQLTDKGKPYNVSDEKLYFKLTKPDGNYVYIDEDDTEHLYKENGKIVIILSDQATAVGGICKAEIQLKKDEKIITTINFHVIVKKSVLSDDAIVSEIESNILDKLTTHVDNDSLHVTPDDKENWNDANEKKHMHENKSVLDLITSTLVDAWNNAVSVITNHVKDTVSHITSAERTLWNTVSNKAEKDHTHTTVNGHTVESDVPANAVFTDTVYFDATTTSSGLMSADDKTTVENLKSGTVTGIKGNAETEYRTGNVNITAEDIGMDVALSTTSTNPVQNKVVTAALNERATSAIVTSGDFNNITTPGVYAVYGCSNSPLGGGGNYGVIVLHSTTGDSYVEQIAVRQGTYDIYIRYLVGGTSWGEWKKMLTVKDISQSTSITTAGTYALDAVQNNASVSGTLANRTKTLEDTIGKIYTKAETVYGSGSWKTSGISLTVPAGVYVITRRGVNINGGGISLGRDYTAGSFITTPADSSTGVYTEIKNCSSSSNTIDIKYCSALNSTNKLELEAVRIK